MTQDSPARLIVERDARVMRLTLSNPSARNALHPDMYAAGRQAFESARTDPDVRAVVLAGEGDVFCAGGNLRRLLENRDKDPALQYASIDAMHAWVRAIRACDKPVVAAVEGAAAGAGFSLVLACDQVVAAEDAAFTMAYVKVGLSPDGGATHGLATRLPYPLAFELACTGAPVGAARLHALGVVNRVVPRGQALTGAMELARAFADGPPRVIARIKRLLDGAAAPGLPAHLDRERDAFLDSLFDTDAGEGIRAFLEKRKPRFGGDAP